MKVEELSSGSQDFLNEIREQLPPVVVPLFNAILDNLGKPSAEVEKKLAKLNALEAGGVDNWEFYDDAMATLEPEGDEDD